MTVVYLQLFVFSLTFYPSEINGDIHLPQFPSAEHRCLPDLTVSEPLCRSPNTFLHNVHATKHQDLNLLIHLDPVSHQC